MKKINKIFLCLALVVVLSVPMIAGCSLTDLFGGNKKQIATIEVVGTIKTEYLVDEEFDSNGAKVRIVYDDDSTKEIILTKSMTNFNSSTTGKKTLVIKYQDFTTSKQYRVDKIKLGKFTYRYEGKLSEYSYNKESENIKLYFNFKKDGTCILKGYSSTEEYLWSYNSAGNITITSEVSNVNAEIKIVSSTIVRIESGTETWIQLFRFTEE